MAYKVQTQGFLKNNQTKKPKGSNFQLFENIEIFKKENKKE